MRPACQLGSSTFAEMRRSACPSIVWKKKKLADGSALACDSNGNSLATDNVNHLDMYKEREPLATVEEVLDELGPRRSRQEVKLVKKNYVINTPAAPPICFAVKFLNLNRTAKKNLQGDGMSIIDLQPFASASIGRHVD